MNLRLPLVRRPRRRGLRLVLLLLLGRVAGAGGGLDEISIKILLE